MQFIDDFFHQYNFFYRDKSPRSYIRDRHQYFVNRFLRLLGSLDYFNEDKFPLLFDKHFCEENWALPVPLLVEEEKIEAVDDFWRETYTDFPKEIGNKKYYAYRLWSDHQSGKAHNWYINTFFGSVEEYYASRARALDAHAYKPIELEDEE